MSKDQAEHLAAAINLKRSDLPGYRATPSQESADDRRQDTRLARCAGGVPPSKDIAKEDSPDFTVGAAAQVRQVSSSVTVLPSAALAAKDLAAVKSTRGRNCFRTFVNGILAKAGNGQVQFGKAQVTTFEPSASGADGAFGYRVRVVARSNGTRIPFYVDGLGFTSGPVEVSLDVMSIGRRFPAADEQKLFATLAQRAQGQST
jgi:hypothetical protein